MSPARDAEHDLTVLAARGGTLAQTFSLAALPRIAALGAGEQSWLGVQLRLEPVDNGIAIRGALTGEVDLECQRCLGRVSILVEEQLDLVVVPSEGQAAQVIEPADAVVADPTRVDLAWLAEEEALLAMPLVPMHPAAQQGCADRSAGSDGDDERAGETERHTPFANLRDLLGKG
ncbi:MAG TPA: DUF177 domain-containing protein [Steroidobacteraceae bacterium]|nr:DUF177 domain-containing protein [Steroidobacteraceae bacterium]